MWKKSESGLQKLENGKKGLKKSVKKNQLRSSGLREFFFPSSLA